MNQELIKQAIKSGYISFDSVAKATIDRKVDDALLRQILKLEPSWLNWTFNPRAVGNLTLPEEYDIECCTFLGAALYADNKTAVRAMLDAGAGIEDVYLTSERESWSARKAYSEFCEPNDTEDDYRIRKALGIY